MLKTRSETAKIQPIRIDILWNRNYASLKSSDAAVNRSPIQK